MNKLVFLPGASGSQRFWQPLMAQLTEYKDQQVMAYPGFDGVPKHPDIHQLDELKNYIIDQIQPESVLIAQSMGGMLAIAAALEKPERIKGLVLIATSGGLDLSGFSIQDWRSDYWQQFAHVPDWFLTDQTRYSPEQLSRINFPVLLLWGDQDPLSPVAVGEHLQRHLQHASLNIIQGGDHFVANSNADTIAPLIHDYLVQL